MCTVFEEVARESEILGRLQKKLDVSLQTAQEYLKKFGER